ncbi:MAG: NAD(P)/FAD-dependent oxidoreductase [Burkholderiaceae bacterium]|nr:NAD(P)/FAD-dependent oxidoreductase [Burkholderiaceae bacterium]
MSKVFDNRRSLLKAGAAGAAVAAAGSLVGCATTETAAPAPKKIGRVIVIGGGYGGATAAKYINMWSGGAIEVYLIERERNFISCPISNLVLGGSQSMETITHSYAKLRERGIVVLNDEVIGIDPEKKKISLKKIADLSYDRLVVSPGIDFNFSAIQGLNEEAQKTILHSWKAGPQTVALKAQLEAVPNGGVYVLSIPKAPYRCPPGPYERACQVAHFFKSRGNTKSKVVIMDANPDIQSKKALFMKAWSDLYPGMVEYNPNMNVTELDLKGKRLLTETGDAIKGDVLNVVPPHRAGDIAQKSGLINVNNLWCGVDWVTMESLVHKNIHVLGDATFPAPLMPKSGHMANQHGKTAAAAIVELMNGRTPIAPMMANTCYSFVDDKNVVHVASVHSYDANEKTMKTVAGSGGVSSRPTEMEGRFAMGWARNIWADMLT